MTPAEIAKGLTKAQRKFVLSLSGEWRLIKMVSRKWTIYLPPNICEDAPPPRIGVERKRLTPIGLAVRAELEKQHDH